MSTGLAARDDGTIISFKRSAQPPEPPHDRDIMKGA